MANLKYYAEERQRYPWHFTHKVNPDAAMMIVERCWMELGLKPIPVRFVRQHDGIFTWSWIKAETDSVNRIELCQINSIGVILHEIAHYMDYLNRCAELDIIDTTGRRGYGADTLGTVVMMMCRKIRKEHFHGPRHKVEMRKVIDWFNRTYPHLIGT